MKAFLETSAYAKRYVAEQGTDKVDALCQRCDSLVVSAICLPELISTLSRLVREKSLMKQDYQKLKHAAVSDLADVEICQITTPVIASSILLLESHPLRAMDALHLACAIAVAADVFVSADHRQLAAARKSGLKVIDVSARPAN
ncbi:MAG: type II toxin-antitoxin system VapC family toxin [Pseudomonadota bacterium]